uniref:J domain-containing protein n=1 Tax=Chlamydomonas leiostraca TaxID=1034604 RepID=A0A7S0RDK0_9CHLO|mmetsp:Transcript_20212/g.51187  ORF Transcript_20212/g.51187 Transcript_20212/m.51187 type:complete len:319 (+) Transcript_20212:84-1040(+)
MLNTAANRYISANSRLQRRSWSTRVATKCARPIETGLVLSSQKLRKLNVQIDESEAIGLSAPENFFALLGIQFDAGDDPDKVDAEELKKAYRRLQKLVHPDIVGDAAHDASVLINAAYNVLSDAHLRAAYVEDLRDILREYGTFDGRPVSAWAGSDQDRAVFVDETTCIGCRACTHSAPSTFFMEEDWGRARVGTQWGDDEELISEAVACCPVDCIHYVERRALPVLEFIMRSCKRESVATMARRRSGNMGTAPSNENPFCRAELYLKTRKEAKVDEALLQPGAVRQNDALAAAIAKAWITLPAETKAKGWPHLARSN